MKFWDSSAIVPLLAQERATQALTRLYEKDAEVIVWWATEIECVSALARREREVGARESGAFKQAFDRLDQLAQCWHEIGPTAEVRSVARRLLRNHALRAADALQLAAAIVAHSRQPEALGFVCADMGLAAAARAEGLEAMGTGD